ncbi:MAG TPA: hypothetical protein VGS01_09485 [Candidatus Limnocylindria bacterium]|jgi:hypothetical protein|nr:hypothetical protein [Candidatus Limnocylindria bacterium]
MAQIVIEVSDEAKALAEEAATHYGFADAAAHAEEWLKNTLIGYRQQRYAAEQVKEKDKIARGVATLFDK